MKAAMEDRTPRSSGETGDEKRGREGKRGKDKQVFLFLDWFILTPKITSTDDKNLVRESGERELM